MGIADTRGVIYDFAAPYTVSVDHMAFGRPTRYLQLRPENATSMTWDDAVYDGAKFYQTQMASASRSRMMDCLAHRFLLYRQHTLLWNNCHSHTAYTLNLMNYSNTRWNAWKLVIMIWTHGHFCSPTAALTTFTGFAIVLLVVLVLAFSLGFSL
ncbi:hypothetical protein BZG36_03717 [Bifiguratus adelaidae]|uniref:Uncharacterized protein n=1 Tax=Bifiguratus adelaidae TaxID=1938954 RepID=A0A261XZ28_9FUNG|nr:hypothetical protein BZG36_03717 [Bifiguratus adelaidae]